MRRPAWVGTVLAAVLVAGAAAAAASVVAQQITVTMREFSYTPDRIIVPVGKPVAITLINKGKLPHEFMIYDRPKSMDAMMGRS